MKVAERCIITDPFHPSKGKQGVILEKGRIGRYRYTVELDEGYTVGCGAPRRIK